MSTCDNDNDQCVGSGGDMKSNKKECTSCEQTDVNNITEGIDSIAIQEDMSMCAACGKEGNSYEMNICNKCKMVKYCNAACKKKHRHKHKKACEKRMAELHDEKLFKQPPPNEECPICFIRLPLLLYGRSYQSCCGKVICSGCVHAPVYDDQGNEVTDDKCPFCRTTNAFSGEEEMIKRVQKRMEAGDCHAFCHIGCYYKDGTFGFPQDYTKALELWHRAGELGNADAYCNIGNVYNDDRVGVVDLKKARYYWELAAMGGDETARYNLGIDEAQAGNINRAVKHFMIATSSGDGNSLKMVQTFYSNGHATKEDYTKALQSYQVYLGEIKSVQRDEAAAYSDSYCYY